jgi:ribose 5-phosphate isomerase B
MRPDTSSTVGPIAPSSSAGAARANRSPPIRCAVCAALCHDEYTARLARQHNDANVLSLGARVLAPELACVILDVFLASSFEGGGHVPRISQLVVIEDTEAARG